MNYQRIYNEIINNAKSRGLNKKLLDGYFEKHHIIPRCMQGTNDYNNLVLLTGREHYLCHYLLWKIYKNKEMMYSIYLMMKMPKRRNHISKEYGKLSSKQYEDIKKQFSKLQKEKITKEESKLKMRASAERRRLLGLKRKRKRIIKILKPKIITQRKRLPKCIEPKFCSYWSLL